MRSLLLALLFLPFGVRAESSMLTNLTVLAWNQTSTYASNVLFYVVYHGGPDGRLTNYSNARSYVIGRVGLLYPATIQTTVFGCSTGTNWFGVAAKLQGGIMSETNVIRVNFGVEQK